MKPTYAIRYVCNSLEHIEDSYFNFYYLVKQVSTNLEDTCNSNLNSNFPLNSNVTLPAKISGEEEPLATASAAPPAAVTGFDLESELREFLESDSALSSFHLPDDVDDTDKTIEQMLSAHS